MQETKFIRHLQIGEYVTPPDPRGITQDGEEDAELTIDEDYLWCKRTRDLDVLAGWVEKFEDGVLTVVVNPVLAKLNVEAVIGAEVEFEYYSEVHCGKWPFHIDCPVCLDGYAQTDLFCGVYEKFEEDGPFPLKCGECNAVFNVLAIDVGYIRASIGTEPDRTALVKRAEKRLERLKAANAPVALIEAEVENLKNLEQTNGPC